jgi:biotin operon repressor
MTAYPDAPGHRGADTSVAAAADVAVKLGRLQRMAEAAIRQAGPDGLTADELASSLDLSRWSIQPRTSELRRKGVVVDSGRRRLNTTGKQAIVWIAKTLFSADHQGKE